MKTRKETTPATMAATWVPYRVPSGFGSQGGSAVALFGSVELVDWGVTTFVLDDWIVPNVDVMIVLIVDALKIGVEIDVETLAAGMATLVVVEKTEDETDSGVVTEAAIESELVIVVSLLVTRVLVVKVLVVNVLVARGIDVLSGIELAELLRGIVGDGTTGVGVVRVLLGPVGAGTVTKNGGGGVVGNPGCPRVVVIVTVMKLVQVEIGTGTRFSNVTIRGAPESGARACRWSSSAVQITKAS